MKLSTTGKTIIVHNLPVEWNADKSVSLAVFLMVFFVFHVELVLTQNLKLIGNKSPACLIDFNPRLLVVNQKLLKHFSYLVLWSKAQLIIQRLNVALYPEVIGHCLNCTKFCPRHTVLSQIYTPWPHTHWDRTPWCDTWNNISFKATVRPSARRWNAIFFQSDGALQMCGTIW